MPNPLFRPPRHLVKEWPEVFEDLYMNTMPVTYIDLIHLEFNDGRVWQLDVKSQLTEDDADSVAERLMLTIGEYKDTISKIDFKIDIERLKKDIADSTKTLF
jgi:cyanate lyase